MGKQVAGSGSEDGTAEEAHGLDCALSPRQIWNSLTGVEQTALVS